MQTYKLDTIVKDNYGHDYTTSLVKRDSAGEWVLRIDNTPGQWCVCTLQGTDPWSNGRVGDSISIDFGANWYATGISNALLEAEAFLATLDN
jgi:hypothetical protein